MGDDHVLHVQVAAGDEFVVAARVGRRIDEGGVPAPAIGDEVGEVAVPAGVYLVEDHGAILRRTKRSRKGVGSRPGNGAGPGSARGQVLRQLDAPKRSCWAVRSSSWRISTP